MLLTRINLPKRDSILTFTEFKDKRIDRMASFDYFQSGEPDISGKKRYPWIYIPSAYFAEGVPYVIVNIVSVVMYQNLGIPNSLIGLSSLLYLPWVIKMFWGPVVDIYLTKRLWMIGTQAAMAILFLFSAVSLLSDFFFAATLIVFTLIAFVSATHDIATDGFYMIALKKDQQAFFVGIRSLFYRIAMWFGQGFILIFTGWIIGRGGGIEFSWLMALMLCSVIFLILALFHLWYLPRPVSDTNLSGDKSGETKLPFIDVFRTYFSQPKIFPILSFILLYRLGESMLTKMSAPFLLDEIGKGGLGLTNTDLGLIQGTIGLASLIIGGIAGGVVIAKYGLRKCIWPMAIALNLPDVFYIYLAYAKPALSFVYPAIAIEQFGYGLGFTAFMVFLMYIAKSKYKTSHFAISTGLMALGMMVPGMISGFLQEALGYQNFFVAVLLLTIPGMAAIFFIPVENNDSADA